MTERLTRRFTVGASLLVLAAVVLALLAAGLGWYWVSRESGSSLSPAEPAALTVGVVGDHDDTRASAAVFQNMGRDRVDVIQSLGDLSYNDTVAEAFAWCRFVKENLSAGAGQGTDGRYGENVPLQIVEGNHDDLLEPYISRRCFPDRFTSVTAEPDSYGREYYYDVPRGKPLVRFILTPSTGPNAYQAGTARYEWLSQAIDSARDQGVPWVIVGQHKNYISSGTKKDEVGSDYFNLLLRKKVDVILQAHDHTYQRTKQLALGDSCPSLDPGPANLGCLADAERPNTYEAGRGTVLVINGSGGRTLYNIDKNDPEAPYFAAAVGANNGGSYGYLKLTITDRQLAGTYVVAAGKGVTDTFRITQPR